MGILSDWEKVKPEQLGSGGQSIVFLVRRPERRAAREKSLKTLRDLSAQGLSNQTAIAFAQASWDIAREEQASELGALKMFHPRAAGPEGEQQALGRSRTRSPYLSKIAPGF